MCACRSPASQRQPGSARAARRARPARRAPAGAAARPRGGRPARRARRLGRHSTTPARPAGTRCRPEQHLPGARLQRTGQVAGRRPAARDRERVAGAAGPAAEPPAGSKQPRSSTPARAVVGQLDRAATARRAAPRPARTGTGRGAGPPRSSRTRPRPAASAVTRTSSPSPVDQHPARAAGSSHTGGVRRRFGVLRHDGADELAADRRTRHQRRRCRGSRRPTPCRERGRPAASVGQRQVLRPHADDDLLPVGAGPRRAAGSARAGDRDPSVAATVPGEQVHRRRPDEVGHERVGRAAGTPRAGVPTWRIRPASMTAIRSASASASAWSWVTNTVVTPSSRCSRLRNVRASSRSRASRLDSGSSNRNTAGWQAIARASATRCCWPPESWPGRRSSSASRPSPRADLARPRASRSAAAAADPQRVGDVVARPSCAGTARSPGTPSRRRARRAAARVTSRSPMRTVPAGRRSPGRRWCAAAWSCRSRTGPSSAKNSPSAIVEVEGVDAPARRPGYTLDEPAQRRCRPSALDPSVEAEPVAARLTNRYISTTGIEYSNENAEISARFGAAALGVEGAHRARRPAACPGRAAG